MARPLTTKEVMLVSVLAFLGAGAALVNFVLLPLSQRAAALRSQVQNLESSVAQIRAELKNQEELEQKLKDAQAEIDAFENLIPEDKDVPGLLRELEVIAARCDVRLPSIGAGQPIDKKTHYELSLSLPISGDYRSVLRFISELTSARRLITIKSVSFAPTSGTQMNVSIQAAAYMRGGAGSGPVK